MAALARTLIVDALSWSCDRGVPHQAELDRGEEWSCGERQRY
jgi:hypothetical protein